MIFEQFLTWVQDLGIFVYIPAILVAISIVLGTFSLSKLVVRTRPKEAEGWRDPPPVLFKLFKPIIQLFSRDVRSLMSDDFYNKVANRLSAAGMNYAIMAHEFITLKIVCVVIGAASAIGVYKIDESLGPDALIVLFGLIPAGFFYPDIWLADKVSIRRRAVAKEFPFLLDLLTLSMRAGLNYSTSLGQAIASLPHGPVKDEFSKLLREIRAGKARREALLDLAARMNIDSVNNFVAAINQAEETGGEIVDVLTVQAEQKRSERFTTAEETANKAPVRMLIPMMAFLFPIIFMLMGFVMVVKLAEIDVLPASMLRLLMS